MTVPAAPAGSDASVRIVPYVALAGRAALDADLDAIFFEASNRKSFLDAAERAAFRDRWLGRFLRLFPAEAFLALDAADRPAGYLAGCLVDPATLRIFDDIGYFAELATLTRRFPAHLHINVAPGWRSHGVGALLIEAFAAHARTHGVGGMHIVTGRGMRNVAFYERCGFAEVGHVIVAGRELVMLARDTAPRPATPMPAGPS